MPLIKKYVISQDLEKVLSSAKYYLSQLGEVYWSKYEAKGIKKFEEEYAEIHQIISALQDLQNVTKPEIQKV